MSKSKVDKQLKTMRAGLSRDEFSAPLWNALVEYDECRQEFEPYTADSVARHGSEVLQRLIRGMRRMTRKGILQISARHWDDQHYVALKWDDYFNNLVGLFYFSAGEKGDALIAAILKAAWRKGGKQ